MRAASRQRCATFALDARGLNASFPPRRLSVGRPNLSVAASIRATNPADLLETRCPGPAPVSCSGQLSLTSDCSSIDQRQRVNRTICAREIRHDLEPPPILEQTRPRNSPRSLKVGKLRMMHGNGQARAFNPNCHRLGGSPCRKTESGRP